MSSPAIEKTAKTPLYDLHVALGAKMVPFAGYDMPVQYPEGIKTEHLHTRTQAGLFDVSHMGQILLQGENVDLALEKLVPIDVQSLVINQQRYALLTNEKGGILDDLMVTRWADDCIGLIVNAACKHADLAHLKSKLSDIDITYLDNYALLALQGPRACEVLEKIIPEVSRLVFMDGLQIEHNGTTYRITRSGYTGEDGFEIALPADQAADFAKRLLEDEQVKAIGLGARDSLRLEAGLCLYGHDMNTDTTPLEAALLWSISKSRRPDGDKANGYIGSDVIAKQMQQGITRKRVGLAVEGKAPVREGAEIINSTGEKVGVVTSGGYSPSLSVPVAMGYVDKPADAIGTSLKALVRGREIPITVAKLPFVKQNYYRG